MTILSVSRRAAALTFAIALTACSSTPQEETSSTQAAPGTQSRPILSADEAQNFVQAHYFSAINPGEAAWTPEPVRTPQQPDFVVGPAASSGITHTSIQAAVDAAITRHSSDRQYIAILPGEYEGTVYIPAASASVTLYGVTGNAGDVKIGLSLDSEFDMNTWRHAVNPSGKYMPGKPAWYMFDSCQSRRYATVGIMCSAVVWSQNNGLQLQNLTIQNTLGDSVDAGNHQAVALRTDGDKVQLDNVHLQGRQNTFFVTNSDIKNRLLTNRQPRTLVTNSYIEGDVDIVAGRGTVVFDHTDFLLVSSRTREGYVFAPATLPGMFYGFLATNSRFIAVDGAQLGRAWDVEASENRDSAGQVVIRDSLINNGFNAARPWGNALGSGHPFAGNPGTKDENNRLIRDLNEVNFNRMWEFNNSGQGSLTANER